MRSQGGGRGGHNAKEYWLTLDMAKELAMLERNEQGKRARRYFIECEKRLRRRTLDFNSPEGLRALLLETTDKWAADRHRLEAEKAVEVERAVVAEGKALDQAKQAGREERAIPLSFWLNHTMNRHGHGPIVGRKMMSALGRQTVNGRRRTASHRSSERICCRAASRSPSSLPSITA